MKKYDIILSCVLFIGSIALYFYAETFPFNEDKNIVLNPGFYPQFLAIIMGVLALLLLVTTLRKKFKDIENNWKQGSIKSIRLTFFTLIMVIIYPIGLQYIGFLLTTLFFTFVLIYVLSDKSKYDVRFMSFVSFVITLIVFFVFDIILNIPFPRGIF